MRLKIIPAAIGLLILSMGLGAVKKIQLADIKTDELNMGQMLICQDRLIIAAFPHIILYSMADFSFIKKFGQSGNGPGQFINYIYVYPSSHHQDHFIVSSHMKVSRFNLDGQLLKEIKAKEDPGTVFTPWGNQFVAYAYTSENHIFYNTINLYDAQLHKIREIHRERFFIQPGQRINPLLYYLPWFLVQGDRLFITVDQLNKLDVFDQKGEKRCTIKPDLPKIKVTEAAKKGIHHFFKTHSLWRMKYEQNKHLLKFPDYFPKISEFFIDNNKIYITGYEKKNKKSDILILNLQGKLLKKISDISLQRKNTWSPYPFIIKNEIIHQMVKGKTSQTWSLYLQSLQKLI